MTKKKQRRVYQPLSVEPGPITGPAAAAAKHDENSNETSKRPPTNAWGQGPPRTQQNAWATKSTTLAEKMSTSLAASAPANFRDRNDHPVVGDDKWDESGSFSVKSSAPPPVWVVPSKPAPPPKENFWLKRREFIQSAMPQDEGEEERMLQAALELSRLQSEEEKLRGQMNKAVENKRDVEEKKPALESDFVSPSLPFEPPYQAPTISYAKVAKSWPAPQQNPATKAPLPPQESYLREAEPVAEHSAPTPVPCDTHVHTRTESGEKTLKETVDYASIPGASEFGENENSLGVATAAASEINSADLEIYPADSEVKPDDYEAVVLDADPAVLSYKESMYGFEEQGSESVEAGESYSDQTPYTETKNRLEELDELESYTTSNTLIDNYASGSFSPDVSPLVSSSKAEPSVDYDVSSSYTGGSQSTSSAGVFTSAMFSDKYPAISSAQASNEFGFGSFSTEASLDTFPTQHLSDKSSHRHTNESFTARESAPHFPQSFPSHGSTTRNFPVSLSSCPETSDTFTVNSFAPTASADNLSQVRSGETLNPQASVFQPFVPTNSQISSFSAPPGHNIEKDSISSVPGMNSGEYIPRKYGPRRCRTSANQDHVPTDTSTDSYTNRASTSWGSSQNYQATAGSGETTKYGYNVARESGMIKDVTQGAYGGQSFDEDQVGQVTQKLGALEMADLWSYSSSRAPQYNEPVWNRQDGSHRSTEQGGLHTARPSVPVTATGAAGAVGGSGTAAAVGGVGGTARGEESVYSPAGSHLTYSHPYMNQTLPPMMSTQGQMYPYSSHPVPNLPLSGSSLPVPNSSLPVQNSGLPVPNPGLASPVDMVTPPQTYPAFYGMMPYTSLPGSQLAGVLPGAQQPTVLSSTQHTTVQPGAQQSSSNRHFPSTGYPDPHNTPDINTDQHPSQLTTVPTMMPFLPMQVVPQVPSAYNLSQFGYRLENRPPGFNYQENTRLIPQ